MNNGGAQRIGYRGAKRALDIVAAVGGLLVASPVMAVVAVVVRVTMGRPVLFRQSRVGVGGRTFTIVKFRTMRVGRGEEAAISRDGERITALGRLLRRSSIDELPSLWNVLAGDMSLVGPRPLLVKYVPRYSPHQARRLEVKPGLTGWCQVNGRNSLSWQEKFDLDVWYVDHASMALDLRILAATIATVLSGRGVGSRQSATMPEFLGNG